MKFLYQFTIPAKPCTVDILVISAKVLIIRIVLFLALSNVIPYVVENVQQ